MSNIIQFLNKENAIPSLPSKNCKHFAYDFFAEVVNQESIGDFGGWSQQKEQTWKANNAW